MPNEPNQHPVVVEVNLAASAEQVYDAWLDPERIRQWFGPGLGETQPVQTNPIVGGKFSIVQVRAGNPIRHLGEYLVLKRPTDLAFTWQVEGTPDCSEVHIQISALEPDERGKTGCRVRLTHWIDKAWISFADKCHHAWLTMVQEMDKHLRSS